MTYRHSAYEVCFFCGERATLCCPRCSRPFCSDHGIFGADARCGDCERGFARQQDTRTFVAALTGVTTWAGVTGTFLSMGSFSWVWSPFTVLCGLVAASVVGGPWKWRSRRRFLGEGRGETVIAGALTISAHGGSEGVGLRKLSSGRQPRDRGLPSVPIYQRTYGH